MPETRSALSVGEIVAGSYKVLGMAGAGGMGVVYRALDLKLERTVALKFLPPELMAGQTEKARFLREARTASSLDHPNIGVIHGIEELADGRTFIVMAFYEGQSLAERIRNGPLGCSQAVDIAIQMAQGLRDAHVHHIVHRDIKPSNVMLTGNRTVKIVDFGLAQVVSAQTASQTGFAGTLSYMAPEQALGKLVDQRTDIWALGAVLAEMLMARGPFERETVPATLMAILNEPPHPLDGVPLELQQIVYRTLAKEPEARYQQCSELLTDLEALRPRLSDEPAQAKSQSQSQTKIKHSKSSAGVRRALEHASRPAWTPPLAPRPRWIPFLLIAVGVMAVAASAVLLIPSLRQRLLQAFSGSSEKHIAVLPFDNIGNNPENDALVQGLMDSLAGKLSNLDVGNQSLWIVPTSEVRRLKVADPADALKQLGANLVVKGSVERDGRDVRLNVNLIDTRNLRQIGSADLEDQAGDLSTLQNEAVARLARLMNISVTAGMLSNTGGAVNPAAYEDYLTALGHMQRYDKPGNLDLAIAALNTSVHTDPRFALGYAQLGEAYRLKYRIDQNPRWLDEALANCQKAAELDNRMPAVYVTLGQIHEAGGKHDLALQEFRHALDLDPKDAAALTGLAHAYEDSGRVADAEAAYQKAAALRPNEWDGFNNLGNFLDRQGKYPQAIAQYQRALELTPDNAQVLLNMGGALVDSGVPALMSKAEGALQRSIALNPSYGAYANLGFLYYQQRRYPEAAGALEKAISLNDQDPLVWQGLVNSDEWLKQPQKAEDARRHEIPLLEAAIQLKPQDAIAHGMLADLYAGQHQPEKALAHIQSALALAPDDAQNLGTIADAYVNLGDRRQALVYAERALKHGATGDQLKTDPELQPIIDDPELKSLLK
jgi:serine/threonine protein kinase/tetratricopeptide (TPR) repeat protein